MKNQIRSNGKIWERRSKNLKSGEVSCQVCGDWQHVAKLTSKHFDSEFVCSTCRKEAKASEPIEVKPTPTKKKKIGFPENCPHKPFFGCIRASDCVGCYYNPDVKVALMLRDPEDSPKTAKMNWFYGDKKNAKKRLETLEDIRHGRGLMPGGNRSYMKYGRKTENNGDE